jgi:hypothetical protein
MLLIDFDSYIYSFTFNSPTSSFSIRSESVYLTISLADVKDQKIELTTEKLTFTGTSNGKAYAANFEFVSILHESHIITDYNV